MTRADTGDLLALAAKIGIGPTVTTFSLDRVDDALRAVATDAIDGAAVISVGSP